MYYTVLKKLIPPPIPQIGRPVLANLRIIWRAFVWSERSCLPLAETIDERKHFYALLLFLSFLKSFFLFSSCVSASGRGPRWRVCVDVGLFASCHPTLPRGGIKFQTERNKMGVSVPFLLLLSLSWLFGDERSPWVREVCTNSESTEQKSNTTQILLTYFN